MEILNKLVKHYPWLPSKKKYYSEIASTDPVEFIKQKLIEYPDGDLVDRLFTIFKAAFENMEVIRDYNADELNVYLYTFLKIILYINNDIRITNRVANLYSKHTYNEILNEKGDYNLYAICIDLKFDVKYYEQPISFGLIIDKDSKQVIQTQFSIHYIDYLKLASNLRDDYRKLVHNALVKGYVYLQKKDLIRLLQEVVRNEIYVEIEEDLSTLETFKNRILEIKEIRDLNERILDLWELKKEEFGEPFEFTYKQGEDTQEIFPPCIRAILTKIDEGQNLIHLERLFLVFFLHALKIPINEIVDLFAKLPDFDRKKTEYQVEFAKKKGYVPHSCPTLKSYNLCMQKNLRMSYVLMDFIQKN